jgi:hypothetical protein
MNRKKYFAPKSVKWEWIERKPRKLFASEEFQMLRPTVRREA